MNYVHPRRKCIREPEDFCIDCSPNCAQCDLESYWINKEVEDADSESQSTGNPMPIDSQSVVNDGLTDAERKQAFCMAVLLIGLLIFCVGFFIALATNQLHF